jgi:hypothetical protein
MRRVADHAQLVVQMSGEVLEHGARAQEAAGAAARPAETRSRSVIA